MKQNRRRKKRRGSNRGVSSICFIVMILLVSLSVQSHGLKEKLNVYAAQKEELQQKIDSETARTGEIKKLEEYKNTTEYVEEIAKDKLGLVYKDEIIFKPSN
ncbi:MAG: septum formation initiator family protein [Lachnospiraceae bacterium]|nr:septum formation initiator family protein [Lachnospiraceae bacterium]